MYVCTYKKQSKKFWSTWCCAVLNLTYLSYCVRNVISTSKLVFEHVKLSLSSNNDMIAQH